MKHRTARAALFVTSAVAALAGAAPAFAQSTLGEIVVTARRVEERLQDVPISMTVFNQDQIDNRNITNPTDLATYTPSLSANSRFGPEKAAFAIRGFTQEGPTSPSVAVYFADVVAPRAAGGTTSGNTIGVGQLFDLQNVQVLKGPQGTLFGRNTTGGAVLFVPQRPVDRFEGYIEGSVGNYDMRRVQGVLNIPITETFRVRAGFDRMKRDGYLKNHSDIGPGDFNDTDYWAGRLSIVGELTPNLENYFIGAFSDSDTNGQQSHIALCNRDGSNTGTVALLYQQPACAQLDRGIARGDDIYDVENNNPRAFQRLQQYQLINTTTWTPSDNLTIKNIASFSRFRERVSFTLNGENFGPGYPQYIVLDLAPGQDNASQQSFTEELQFQGEAWDDRLTWQAGGYLEVSDPVGFSAGYTSILLDCTDIQSLQCTDPFGGLFSSLTGQDVRFGSISNSATKTYFNNKALYGQATYNITDQLALTGGLRYTWDKTRQVSQYRRIQFPAVLGGVPTFVCNDPRIPGDASDALNCRRTFKQKSDKPTWLINLDYKPTDDLMFYGKYARGYRQGGIASLNIGLETWGPEKVDAFEIGAKTSFRGAVSGYFNIAAFYNDFRDMQIQGNLIARPGSGFAGGNAIINAGKSEIKGIEIDASISPLTGLRFDLGYTYLDTKLKKISLPTLGPDSPFIAIIPNATAGNPLALSPKNRLTLTGSYTLPLDENIGQVSLSATYVHTDKQIASLATPLGTLPASDLLNLNLNWNEIAGRPIDFAVFATNVTKQKFPVNVGQNYASAGWETLIANQPRMYGVRLRYRFGAES
jgi:iron complex outermembrane receptor protein